jgi:putative colanic acid biosynthesis UDP-glucose lipid carrier transferase
MLRECSNDAPQTDESAAVRCNWHTGCCGNGIVKNKQDHDESSVAVVAEFPVSSLADVLRPLSDERPGAMLLRLMLAPVVCVLMLMACALALGEPFSARYVNLAVVTFVVSLQVFGEMPLAEGEARAELAGPVERLLLQWAAVMAVLLLLGFVTKLTGLYSRKVVLCWLALTPLALVAARALACHLLPRVMAGGVHRGRVIVGASRVGDALAERIGGDPCLGEVAGFFDDRQEPRVGQHPLAVLGGIGDVVPYVKRHHVAAVYIALPVTSDERIRRMVQALRDTTASVYFVPDTLPFDTIQGRVAQVGGIPLIAVLETPFYGLNAVLKRCTDLTVATLALLILWPLMLAIAAGVKLGSPGPALFRQRRYGLDGEEFRVFKFRTMTVCEDGAHVEQAKQGDARVTPLGALLRRTSLDELPQFLNVLEGSMSVVGPRPHAVAHNEQYRRLIQGYMLRHKVKPGITGWAQVNGLRGETQSVERMRKRIEHDLDYLRNWSLTLDMRILLRTPFVVLKGPNAY